MKKAIKATHAEFESSSGRTPEYLAWHRLFKREFTKFLEARGMTGIAIGSPNHFDMSGFFKDGGKDQIWYFSLSDLRGFKDNLLIRTAKHYKDFTGGMNQYAPLTTEDAFTEAFERIMKSVPPKPSGNVVQDINHAIVTHPYVANTIATMGSWK
jgi:hypothetical protein